MTIRLLIACALLLPALQAMDWDKVPKLPHKLVADWAQLPAGWNFGETSGVSVDNKDNIWVFNRGKHPVVRFDKSGKFLGAWDEVPILSSHGIKVDPEGNIWLVDVEGHSLMKFTPAGRLLMVMANPGRKAGDNESQYSFNRPTGLSFKPGGDLYVSDGYVNSRVVEYDKTGKYVRQWGRKGKGDGDFDLVHDVALDKQGRVYVADRNNSRVQIFDAQGKFLNKWTDVGQPWGLAYSEKENAMYICDGLNNHVIKTNLDGQVQGILGGFGKAPGRFDFPHHMAIDSEGSLYIAEIKNWRVQKFSK